MDREEIHKNLVEEFYEDFNECERAQHLLDCEYCELYKKYGRCHLGEYITDYQMPIIKKAQTDLLKEFVEWLKYEYAREEHFEMKEAKDCQQKEYTYLYEYHRGREAMAEKIRDMLDQDLKKFMEERK